MVTFLPTDDLTEYQKHNALLNAGMFDLRRSPIAEFSSTPDPAKWDWEGENEWTRAPAAVQKFYDHWYDADAAILKELGDSQTLDIGDLLPFFSTYIIGDMPTSIFVRASYATMFANIYRSGLNRPASGVIVSGQSGTGASLFVRVYYMLTESQGKTMLQFLNLACLLQLKQSVLFSIDGQRVLLFHNRQAYSSTVAAHSPLPKPREVNNNKAIKPWIWSLLDIPEQAPPDSYLVARSNYVIPVQTVSPDTPRNLWWKLRVPHTFYLDRWTIQELHSAFVLPSCGTNIGT